MAAETSSVHTRPDQSRAAQAAQARGPCWGSGPPGGGAHGDAAPNARAVGQRLGHVVRVAGEAAADVLGQDGRAARARMLQLLQHEHACARVTARAGR